MAPAGGLVAERDIATVAPAGAVAERDIATVALDGGLVAERDIATVALDGGLLAERDIATVALASRLDDRTASAASRLARAGDFGVLEGLESVLNSSPRPIA